MIPNLRTVTLLRETVADWQTYPFDVPAIATFGENGSGKSACGFGPEGGSRNFR